VRAGPMTASSYLVGACPVGGLDFDEESVERCY